MIVHETSVRVRYADTDQMGYVYYGKYPEYFEVGRVEMLRFIGISYREVEEKGILMPVADLEIKYHFPAYYDELLTVKTMIPELPRSSFLTTYELFNPQGQKLVSGMVRLAFFDRERQRPVRVPAYLLELVQGKWPES
ncbi:MAG: thioesterase family protein [Bacteroidota bacterium]